MAEKQYAIGKFAALNKITPRMLRHYDKIGLLKPDAILENGYRAYTSTQIGRVSEIRLYQSCGFTLAEILPLLDTDESGVKQAAKAKLAELDRQDKTLLAAREQLLNLTEDFPKPFCNRYHISYTQQREQLLFRSATPTPEEKIEAAIRQLYHTIAKLGIRPEGFCLLLSDLERPDAYRVAVPVREAPPCHGYECTPLEAGWYLSTIHHGDYFSIGMAYDCLIRHAEEQGYTLKSPFLERYVLDAGNTAHADQYCTQILVQLTP